MLATPVGVDPCSVTHPPLDALGGAHVVDGAGQDYVPEAELARRSPERLRWCRTCLPIEASIEAPQSSAKAAALRRGSELLWRPRTAEIRRRIMHTMKALASHGSRPSALPMRRMNTRPTANRATAM